MTKEALSRLSALQGGQATERPAALGIPRRRFAKLWLRLARITAASQDRLTATAWQGKAHAIPECSGTEIDGLGLATVPDLQRWGRRHRTAARSRRPVADSSGLRQITIDAGHGRNIQIPIREWALTTAIAIAVAAAQGHRQAAIARNRNIRGLEADRAVVEIDLLAEDLALQRLDEVPILQSLVVLLPPGGNDLGGNADRCQHAQGNDTEKKTLGSHCGARI